MSDSDLLMQVNLIKEIEDSKCWLNNESYDEIIKGISNGHIFDIPNTYGYSSTAFQYGKPTSIYVIQLICDNGEFYNVYANGNFLYTLNDNDDIKLLMKHINKGTVSLTNTYKK